MNQIPSLHSVEIDVFKESTQYHNSVVIIDYINFRLFKITNNHN